MDLLTIDHGKVEVSFGATGEPTLPPLWVGVRTGAAYLNLRTGFACLQAYLTPTEALAFASMLIELAATAEEVDA